MTRENEKTVYPELQLSSRKSIDVIPRRLAFLRLEQLVLGYYCYFCAIFQGLANGSVRACDYLIPFLQAIQNFYIVDVLYSCFHLHFFVLQ